MIIGFILLIVFGVSIFLIGCAITRVAKRMNNTLVDQLCLHRFDGIASELYRTEQIGKTAQDFFTNSKRINEEDFEALASTLLNLDPKVGRVWLCRPELSSRPMSLSRTLASDSAARWTLTYDIENRYNKNRYRIGLEVYLSDFYSYMADRPSATKSYVSVVDRSGRVLLHPDSLLLGTLVSDNIERQRIEDVCSEQSLLQHTVMSEYVGMPVERIYYPLVVNGQQLVVVVNILHISINEEMSEFHRYTLLIALIAVVLFSVLLAFSQARWKREYHLRRKAEQESLKIQLQQIVNQINPHFLFNSLNSLYALIGRNETLAREFVLSLSKVYRHVLESGKDPVSSLANEIDFVREYYFLQKIRFNEQIDLRLELNAEYEGRRLPSMSVQTVVENAIKHNKITPDNPLIISIFTEGQRLVIENNYTPREDSKEESFGVGLERIHTIYKLYTDEKMTVTCDGHTFRCELPLLS